MIVIFADISDVHSFLTTYPHDVPFAAGFGTFEVLQYVDFDSVMGTMVEGNVIGLAGDNLIRRTKTVSGRVTEVKLTNFAIIIRRLTNIDELRRDTAVFVKELIEWVNDENRKRKTPDENPKLPKFGNTNNESMTATGGYKTGVHLDSGQPFADFIVQLHFDYELMSFRGVLLQLT